MPGFSLRFRSRRVAGAAAAIVVALAWFAARGPSLNPPFASSDETVPTDPASAAVDQGPAREQLGDDGSIEAWEAADPAGLAASAALRLESAGWTRLDDHSRPGRLVRRYQRQGQRIVVSCGRLANGAFVASAPEGPRSAWMFLGDEESPVELRERLPVPPDPAAPGTSR